MAQLIIPVCMQISQCAAWTRRPSSERAISRATPSSEAKVANRA